MNELVRYSGCSANSNSSDCDSWLHTCCQSFFIACTRRVVKVIIYCCNQVHFNVLVIAAVGCIIWVEGDKYSLFMYWESGLLKRVAIIPLYFCAQPFPCFRHAWKRLDMKLPLAHKTLCFNLSHVHFHTIYSYLLC